MKIKNIVQALAVVSAIGIALAFGTNAGEYAAPTAAEIESHEYRELSNLCAAEGWPADSKIAYELACKGELRRNPLN